MSSVFGAGPDVQEIVRRSVEQNQRDWKLAPEYTFTERDVVTNKQDKVTRRTYKVWMIDGSPYNQLIEENGQELAPTQADAERKKLEEEIARRKHESPSARNRRIAAYQRDREQEHTLLREMVSAFDFSLIGQEQLNGHNCYVLDAVPRPGYQPTSNETKVLTGMRGKMWIDTREYQWVKVRASVFRSVPIALFLADVRPGTEFMLEQVPVDQGIWLPSHFVTKVRATALMIWSKNYTRDETYFDYHRAGAPGNAGAR
jgi:hypothetical protein